MWPEVSMIEASLIVSCFVLPLSAMRVIVREVRSPDSVDRATMRVTVTMAFIGFSGLLATIILAL
jgi:hypothetical protein